MVFPDWYILEFTPEIIAADWPALKEDDYEIKSLKTSKYNCLSWALNIDTPPPLEMFYFQKKHALNPDKLDHTITGYTKILAEYYGYEVCPDVNYEEGFEKIALYGDANGEWTHAARQLQDGKWVSKIGRLEDIIHKNLECLNGGLYGEPKIYMKRPM